MKKAEGKSPKSEVGGRTSRFTFHVSRPSFQAAPHTSHHSHSPRIPLWLLAVLLGLVTLALYWPAMGFGFLAFDDPGFVTENAYVQGGLSWAGVKWAFQLNQGDYWHPLTWLSLMLDMSLFGQKAAGFHFMNVVFHAVNSGLLFLLLRRLTGAFWRSVVVAALFALHPLRVESVVWVTERKDVLSGCFGLLALICYARYAERRMQNAECRMPNAKSGSQQPAPPLTFHVSRFTFHVSLFYLLSLCFFACGLMSKAMLVTWPFVMLLLDYWPLRRMQNAEAGDPPPPSRFTFPVSRNALLALLFEKIPFFVLSGSMCAITILTERGVKESAGWVGLPASLRLENAFVAYARYVGKTFWPVNLAVPYTRPDAWSGLVLGASVLVVAGLVVIALWLGRRWAYLLVGLGWFMGTLIPVIGLTQGWGSFMADRFTYVSSIGLLLAVVWGAYELTRRWRSPGVVLAVGGAVAIVFCLGLTRHQLAYWQDSETLFRHALAVTENNDVAHNNLGTALEKKGQMEEAFQHYQEAMRVKPGNVEAHNNLGVAFGRKGQMDEAVKQYQAALRLKPDHADARNNLGAAYDKQGQTDEAIKQYREVLRLKPEHVGAHDNLGAALGKKGQTDEAISQFQEALRLRPDYAQAHYHLGIALAKKGEMEEAIRQLQQTLRLQPDHADARNNLGALLDKQGQSGEAIHQYEAALKLEPDQVEAHFNLGLVLGQKGQMEEAIRHLQAAVRLKPDHVGARINLGVALSRQGQMEEAICQYQEALRLKPEDAAIHFNLGAALAKRGQFDEAIPHYQEAVRLEPNLAETHNNLGTALHHQGRIGEAIREFQEALRLKPDYTDARNNLVVALAVQSSPALPPSAATNR